MRWRRATTRPRLLGFGFASFAICWAWINFSWFASAYDTDDWIFRIVTMVQMIGVLVLAIGLPRMFASIEHGEHLDNSVMVLGYVIMRVALVFQWLRAARQDPARRRACLTYAIAVSIAQIGWVVLIFVDFSLGVTFILSRHPRAHRTGGPVIAERKDGGTPWHAHHIAERHGLFAIIALGEGVVGTVAALSAVVEQQGWTMDAALVGIAGTGLTFGMWWVYYMLPSAPGPPCPPRSILRLGLRPDADRHRHRRIGYEVLGHRHQAEALAERERDDANTTPAHARGIILASTPSPIAVLVADDPCSMNDLAQVRIPVPCCIRADGQSGVIRDKAILLVRDGIRSLRPSP